MACLELTAAIKKHQNKQYKELFLHNREEEVKFTLREPK